MYSNDYYIKIHQNIIHANGGPAIGIGGDEDDISNTITMTNNEMYGNSGRIVYSLPWNK